MRRTNIVRPEACLRVGVILLFFLTGVGAALARDRMNGDDVNTHLRGITLEGVYGDGIGFSETYFTDGTIRYQDPDRTDSGRWSVSGDMFCTFYDAQEGGCFVVERESENCFAFFEATKDANGVLSVSSTVGSRGWNSARPATCKTAVPAGETGIRTVPSQTPTAGQQRP